MQNGIKTTVLTAVLALMAGVVLAGQFDLSWSSTDGGGGTSAGGAYALSGTIGQHDAGKMSGGSFAITGGFWAVPGSGDGCTRDPEWICDGDVDGDGQDLPGETRSDLFIFPVTCDDAGEYEVTVSNKHGEVTSDPARLTVNNCP